MQHSSATGQRIFAICVLLIAITLLFFADTELKWKKGASFHLQSGFWSVLALSGMVFFAVLQLLQRPWKLARPAYFDWWQWARLWFGPIEYLVYFLIYVYLVPWLGYLPSTLLVFPLLVLRAGYSSRKYLVLSWIVGIVIVVLFKTLLQVKIPGGELYALFPDALRNFLVLRF
jgi:hypothetical protein